MAQVIKVRTVVCCAKRHDVGIRWAELNAAHVRLGIDGCHRFLQLSKDTPVSQATSVQFREGFLGATKARIQPEPVITGPRLNRTQHFDGTGPDQDAQVLEKARCSD